MKIFLSYRRDDAAGHAGRLFDRLTAKFGKKNVFMDIAAIPLGQDFRKVISEAVTNCDVVLVLIGRHWLGIQDAHGRRRLDDPSDFVRTEVAAALADEHTVVIPVLVHGARMPGEQDLPDNLRRLSGLQAIEISDGRFQHDSARLIEAIKKAKRDPWPPGWWTKKNLTRGAGVFLSLAVVVLMGWMLKGAIEAALSTDGRSATVTINNELALPIMVKINDNALYTKRVEPGAKLKMRLFSGAEFPVRVHWEVLRHQDRAGHPMGEFLSGNYPSVDKEEVVTVTNVIGLTTYFYPMIHNNTNTTCNIVLNDGLSIEYRIGASSAHRLTNITGYYKAAKNSNITMYCPNKTYWDGAERNGKPGHGFTMSPGSGVVDFSFP